MNNKGDYKYGIILYLIMGLLVLTVSIFFIFNEAVFGSVGDKEACWQSVQLRASLPASRFGIDELDFKSDFPLKCKTRVVEIDKDDVSNIMVAQEKIANAMAECWALYGKGDLDVFPASFFKDSYCVPCARIHFTKEAKKDMRAKDISSISIVDALSLKMKDRDFIYYDYLQNSGNKFSAFNFGNALSFNLKGKSFEIIGLEWLDSYIPKFWKNVKLRNNVGGVFEAKMATINISLPEFFYIDKGDLLINYGVTTVDENVFGSYIPYLFYFQSGQDNNPFEEVKKKFIANPLHSFWVGLSNTKGQDAFYDVTFDISVPEKKISNSGGVSFCGSWEGVPA